ncbi:MAG: PAS domain S-box protein [Desulfobacteraceae bacterium]|nr:PAS domain S-box protein [Desulfobacteraceae bacterium]
MDTISCPKTSAALQGNQYQSLFDLVPCMISLQDRNYRLIAYNREFADRFAPKYLDFCYHAYKGLTKKCERCPVEKTFADGLSHYSEETGLNKDGTLTHWIVKTAPLRDEHGEIVGAMEMSLDITHKKELENKLIQSEKKYYAIFNNIPNPVFVLAADTLEILDCNSSVSRIYGYAAEELLGHDFLDFFPPEEQERCRNLFQTEHDISQVRQMNKAGETFFVHLRLSPSEYQDRRVLLVTTSDITDRIEAELKLVHAGKMATLGEMATGIAHELNQPLTVIKAASNYFTKKIRNRQPIPPDVLGEMAREIDQHVDRAATIINHLRQFGRKPMLDSTPVQVNEVLRRAFEMFSQQFKLHQIEVTWALGEALPPIMAEEGRLEQVFINLLLNARDAIEEKWHNGANRAEEVKQIHLKTYLKADWVTVEIIDTGVGIPAAHIDRIFEPFFTTKKAGEGTGIGLSITYSIVKDFNGTIRARSKPGEGACFTLSFPSGGGT